MLSLPHLRTLLAVSQSRTLGDAARRLGLSHSAVSVHIKALENSLGVALLDRSRRPPIPTETLRGVAERSRRIFTLLDEIQALGETRSLAGELRLGVVPSALGEQAPPALGALRAKHPSIRFDIHAGLSGELAQMVRNADLDGAILTKPETALQGVTFREIEREPLMLVCARALAAQDPKSLLAEQPFIWFSRRAWAGQQIEQALRRRGVLAHDAMEVDSLDAVIALVRNGLGVSVTPWRAGRPAPADLRIAPFGDPPLYRVLSLAERDANPRRHLTDALYAELRAAARPTETKGGRPDVD